MSSKTKSDDGVPGAEPPVPCSAVSPSLTTEDAAAPGNATLAGVTVQLHYALPNDPFNTFDCKVVDIGYADRNLVVECPELPKSSFEAWALEVDADMRGHTGPCGPEAQCDGACMDAASAAHADRDIIAVLRLAQSALGAHGPCRNNSCKECKRAFDAIRAALAKAQPPTDQHT